MKYITQDHTYSKLILLSWLLVPVLRLIETAFIVGAHGVQAGIWPQELKGLFFDFCWINLVLIFIYPLYYFLRKKSENLAIGIAAGSILFLCIIHIGMLKFFSYQLIPLDTFIYTFTFQEIWYTIKTSGIPLWSVYLSFAILLAFIILLIRRHSRFTLSQRLNKRITRINIGFALSAVVILFVWGIPDDRFARNKLLYFGQQSIKKYFWNDTALERIPDVKELHHIYPQKEFISSEYPLLHLPDTTDVLGSFLNQFSQKPNIVVIITEGLNDDYIHPMHGAQFMPFLDSLSQRSLYWNKSFTVGERSFAALPSLLGALPYGKMGFNFNEYMPYHQSLISLLRRQGYFTSFFHGTASWFHRNDFFLNYNNCDFILDNSKFDSKHNKIIVGKDQFFWGYHDKALVAQTLHCLDSLNKNPRLDVMWTETTHSPFYISDTSYYDQTLNSLIPDTTTQRQEFFEQYRKYLRCILFLDDALRNYFEGMRKRSDFDNTIFIITGDHPMSEMPRINSLKRYHVPLILFSSKLKKPLVFNQTVSHLDLYQTLLNYLKSYGIQSPNYSTSLGNVLNTGDNQQTKRIPFMDDNRDVIDYLHDDHYLSHGKLYKIQDNLGISQIYNDSLYNILNSELSTFRYFSLNTCIKNKILSDSLYMKSHRYQFLVKKSINSDTTIQEEYFNLADCFYPSEKSTYLDLSLSLNQKPDLDISLVCQVDNSKSKTIFWESSNIDKLENIHHIKIIIPKAQNDNLRYKIYVWNKNKSTIHIKNLKSSLYGEE